MRVFISRLILFVGWDSLIREWENKEDGEKKKRKMMSLQLHGQYLMVDLWRLFRAERQKGSAIEELTRYLPPPLFYTQDYSSHYIPELGHRKLNTFSYVIRLLCEPLRDYITQSFASSPHVHTLTLILSNANFQG